jgi:hypothetical protein
VADTSLGVNKIISFKACFYNQNLLQKTFIIDDMFKILAIVPAASFALVLSALSYALLFFTNAWLTHDLVFGLGVNWIFLPAGLRLFLTLIFGLPGALGIVLASFFISYFGEFGQDLSVCVGVALVSGFAPYLAKVFVLKNVQLQPDLSDLSLQKLMICILAYALFSAGAHQLWFSTQGLENAGTFNNFLVMFIGDVVGSLLLVALIKYGLDVLKRTKRIDR